jgi:hypothetical protein
VKQARTDGGQRVIYTNFAGQAMLEVVRSGASDWRTSRRHNSRGRLVLTAAPSAVTGYDESRLDLLNNQSGVLLTVIHVTLRAEIGRGKSPRRDTEAIGD